MSDQEQREEVAAGGGSSDAPSIVALAREHTSWLLNNRWRVMGKAVGLVTRDGKPMVVRADDALEGVDVLLSAPLDAETTASPYALARALLKSAITTRPEAVGEAPSYYVRGYARLGDREIMGATEAEAITHLLDALLPAEATA